MGLFKKIKELDRTADVLIGSTIKGAANMVTSYTESYTIALLYGGQEVGEFRFSAPDPSSVERKVNSFVKTIPDGTSWEDAQRYFYQLDFINLGTRVQECNIWGVNNPVEKEIPVIFKGKIICNVTIRTQNPSADKKLIQETLELWKGKYSKKDVLQIIKSKERYPFEKMDIVSVV